MRMLKDCVLLRWKPRIRLKNGMVSWYVCKRHPVELSFCSIFMGFKRPVDFDVSRLMYINEQDLHPWGPWDGLFSGWWSQSSTVPRHRDEAEDTLVSPQSAGRDSRGSCCVGEVTLWNPFNARSSGWVWNTIKWAYFGRDGCSTVANLLVLRTSFDLYFSRSKNNTIFIISSSVLGSCELLLR